MSVLEDEARLSAAMAMSVLATGVGLPKATTTTSATSKMTLTTTSQTCRPSVFNFPPRSTVLRFPVSPTKRRIESDSSDLTLSPGSVSPYSSGYGSKQSELSDLDSPFTDRPCATLPPKKRRVARQKSSDKTPVFRKKRLLNDWSHSEAVSPRASQSEYDEIEESNSKTVLDPVPWKPKNNEGAKTCRKYSSSKDGHITDGVLQSRTMPQIIVSPADSSSKPDADSERHPSPATSSAPPMQPLSIIVGNYTPHLVGHPGGSLDRVTSGDKKQKHTEEISSKKNVNQTAVTSSAGSPNISPSHSSPLTVSSPMGLGPHLMHGLVNTPAGPVPCLLVPTSAGLQPVRPVLHGQQIVHIPISPGLLTPTSPSGYDVCHSPAASPGGRQMRQNVVVSPVDKATNSSVATDKNGGVCVSPKSPVDCESKHAKQELRGDSPKSIVKTEVKPEELRRSPLASPDGSTMSKPPGGVSVIHSIPASSSVIKTHRVKTEPSSGGSSKGSSEMKDSPRVSPAPSPHGRAKPSPATSPSGGSEPPPGGPRVPMPINPHQNIRLLGECQMAVRPDDEGDLPLHIAAVQGHLGVIQKVIPLMQMAGVSIDSVNRLQQTPLHLSVITEKPEVTALLLHHGANPNLLNRHGNSSLHLAVLHSSRECLRVILRGPKKPNLQIKNFEGLSPLHSAVLHKKLSLVEELIDAGAEVDLVEGKSGRTSLHLATETNQHDMVKLLLNKGAGVNLQSYSGSTALHLASGRGLQDIVALLLNSGADSTLRNVYMDVAMANGCGTPGSPKVNRRMAKGRPVKPIIISPLSEDSSDSMSAMDLRQKIQNKIKNNCG